MPPVLKYSDRQTLLTNLLLIHTISESKNLLIDYRRWLNDKFKLSKQENISDLIIDLYNELNMIIGLLAKYQPKIDSDVESEKIDVFFKEILHNLRGRINYYTVAKITGEFNLEKQRKLNLAKSQQREIYNLSLELGLQACASLDTQGRKAIIDYYSDQPVMFSNLGNGIWDVVRPGFFPERGPLQVTVLDLQGNATLLSYPYIEGNEKHLQKNTVDTELGHYAISADNLLKTYVSISAEGYNVQHTGSLVTSSFVADSRKHYGAVAASNFNFTVSSKSPKAITNLILKLGDLVVKAPVEMPFPPNWNRKQDLLIPEQVIYDICAEEFTVTDIRFFGPDTDNVTKKLVEKLREIDEYAVAQASDASGELRLVSERDYNNLTGFELICDIVENLKRMQEFHQQSLNTDSIDTQLDLSKNLALLDSRISKVLAMINSSADYNSYTGSIFDLLKYTLNFYEDATQVYKLSVNVDQSKEAEFSLHKFQIMQQVFTKLNNIILMKINSRGYLADLQDCDNKVKRGKELKDYLIQTRALCTDKQCPLTELGYDLLGYIGQVFDDLNPRVKPRA